MTNDVLSLNILQKNENQVNALKNYLGVSNHSRIVGEASKEPDSFKSQLLSYFGAASNSQSQSAAANVDSSKAELKRLLSTVYRSQSSAVTNPPQVDDGWRCCMPPEDPGTQTISDDFQMWKAWNLYSNVVPTEAERVSPSEFLSIVNGVTAEELASAEQKVTPKQEEGLRFFYKGQTGSSSLAGKDVERAIELYNRMFATGLIEHNPVVDINIGVGYTAAKFGANGEIELDTITHKGPLWEYENAKFYAQYITDFPQKLIDEYDNGIDVTDELIKAVIETKGDNSESNKPSIV